MVSRRRLVEDVAGVEGCRRRREVSSGVVEGVRGESGLEGGREVEDAERERVMRCVSLVVTVEDRLERSVRCRLTGGSSVEAEALLDRSLGGSD